MEALPSLEMVGEQDLGEQVLSLQAAIAEANEERAQAAEYGLVLLSEKQALRGQYDELSSLYEGTKRELDNSVTAIRQVQTDYEKRLKEMESQREQLLDEMETRESSLLSKVDKLGEQIRQLERRLKQSTSEQEHLNGHNSYLNSELDRQRRECDILREDNRRLKQDTNTSLRDNTDLKRDVDRLEKHVEKLLKFESECSTLQELNQTLSLESESLQLQYEAVMGEKDELEQQTQHVLQALSEEREAKNILETKIQEEITATPPHPSWAQERNSISPPLIGTPLISHDRPSSRESNMQSTPYSPKRLPSLLSELQSSLLGDPGESLQLRYKEAENTITSLQKEKLGLEEKVASFALEKTETQARMEGVKEEYMKAVGERDALITSLNEELLAREEGAGRLKNRLNTAAAEMASKEIEVEGLKEELQRVKEVLGAEAERAQRELADEQGRVVELKSQLSLLEEQLAGYSRSIDELEAVILSSHAQAGAMSKELHSLHKTVVSLGNDNRRSSEGNSPLPGENPTYDDNCSWHSIQLSTRTMSVPVHNESQALHLLVQLSDQLCSMRPPLEQYTKALLEKSLAHSSAKKVSSDPSSPLATGDNRKTSQELEASIQKWRSKMAHKNEEISNLRAIMKARSTTTDVAVSSLRSKLEGQARAYQTELTRLKHQLKTAKKDRDEHYSLRTMYSKRCEDHVVEITKLKRAIESKNLECEDVMASLKKTIQKKLEYATTLEEYRVEQERQELIPKLLGSSRI